MTFRTTQLNKENEVICLSVRVACVQLRAEFDLHPIQMFRYLAGCGFEKKETIKYESTMVLEKGMDKLGENLHRL